MKIMTQKGIKENVLLIAMIFKTGIALIEKNALRYLITFFFPTHTQFYSLPQSYLGVFIMFVTINYINCYYCL